MSRLARILIASLLVVPACRADRRPTPPAAASAAAPRPSRFDVAAIDAYVAAQLEARKLVGLSLAIVDGGEIVLARGYGSASRSSGAAVTTETAFAIGSVTKQFTCAMALLYAQDGKLSLDDRVASHYPELTRANDITLDDLGSHLAGYPDYYPLDFVDRRMREPIAPDELIRRYATGELDFEPRTRWSYSNTGFVILGRVIEKIGGAPFGELLARRVFEPLGMKHSTFAPPATAPGLATGHSSFALGEPEATAPEAPGWVHAAGAIWSSASDLARWDLALMDGRLLSQESMRRLDTPRTLADGRTTDYGCGIGVRRIDGETVLTHSGAVSGFLAYNAFVPRTRSAVILLANAEHGDPGRLHQEILALLLARASAVPTVSGPPAAEVARELLRQMQRGKLDRARLGDELSAYLDDARVRAAASRLRAFGDPVAVDAGTPRERGGMEVSRVRFTFADGSAVVGLLYRSPDGTVQQFLLQRE
jgi:CubicO group peptidase (beta-lactamase class C family)